MTEPDTTRLSEDNLAKMMLELLPTSTEHEYVFMTGKNGLRGIIRMWYGRDYTFRELLAFMRGNVTGGNGTYGTKASIFKK